MFRGRESNITDIDTPQALAEPIAEEEMVFTDLLADVDEIETESVPLQILKHDAPQQSPDMPVLRLQHAPVQQVSHYRATRPMPTRAAGRTSKPRLIMQITLILITLALAGAAVFSTGFFDKTIASYERVHILSGVVMYNK
ncbi:MAG: hypothetical protein Q8P36_01775 [bacterium]|nr:hypothetical protein [bacterium]